MVGPRPAATVSIRDPDELVRQRMRQAESSLHALALRELDVLREMAEGRTNAASPPGCAPT